jgi:AmmeMemoRadiSam system protein B/AmmeMemoRadiSam system protein A
MKTGKLRALFGVCLMIIIPFVACSKETDSQEGRAAEMGASMKVREPAVAGAFYPGEEEALRSNVTSLLERAQPPALEGRLVALISPHAGYVYSGGVAAHGYSLIRGRRFDAVVIVAPSHHVFFQGSSIYTQGPYRTPLGLIEIDKELAGAIADADQSIQFRPEAHVREHSLEVQLPFLQIAVPGLKIVPIVMADQSLENCKRLAKAITSGVGNRNVLLVASSDLSHFHPYDEAVALDQVIIEHIERYDYEALARDLNSRKAEACGGGPMITVMIAAKDLGATKAVKLKYANSGDVTGDRSGVVGYLSAAIVAENHVGIDLGLRDKEKAELLKLARSQIEARVRGQDLPEAAPEKWDAYPLLKEKMGAFVTLTIDGRLRGCIGHIRGLEPLHTTIAKMAVAAATEDPRFPALRPDELDRIAIEISVLTPFKKIESPEEVEVGRDGIYIEKGMNHGLLLPQVATEYGWDRYKFLDHTCMKAGLPEGSWREGADIYIFSAQIFNEEEVFGKPSRQ